jgi:Sec7-like guanine-nucleotide exchange factor
MCVGVTILLNTDYHSQSIKYSSDLASLVAAEDV